MSLIESWAGSAYAAALGWTVIHSIWEGALIAAILALALSGLRSVRARYAASCSALVWVLAAVIITFVLELPGAGARTENTLRQVFPPWGVPFDVPVEAATRSLGSAAAPWLAAGWIAGVLVFYLYQTIAWISSRRLLRRGVCGATEHWERSVRSFCNRLRISRTVLLLESCLVEAPVVLGHFKPAILLPAGLLTGMPARQVEALLLHELAHIRRYDYLVNMLQRAVEGLLFYHPAVWWISKVIRREREHCADDIAVAMSGDAHEYACALTALEQNRSVSQPALAANGGNLMFRVRRLLYPQRAGSPGMPLFAVALFFTTAVLALAWQTGLPQHLPGLAPNPAETSGTPYLAWLNSDVVYIIADDERAAFLNLKTNEERQKFIEQFWLRRDPTPGTPENEFKQEHYRRLAFANEHFRTASGRSGWRTDRGHIYIVYGPPDEIETHPNGGRVMYPYEEWLYRHIEGVGDRVVMTFIDRTRSGDYRIAPRPLR